jgi:hypothetical protein
MQQGNRPGWLPEVQEKPHHVRNAQSPFLERLHVIRSGWFPCTSPFNWKRIGRNLTGNELDGLCFGAGELLIKHLQQREFHILVPYVRL